ncbi:MAG: GTPase ArgK [bacterium]|nr:GTPase ArgK [bacterium]
MPESAPLPGSLLLLLEGAREGDPRSLGRLCSVVEAGGGAARQLLQHLDPAGGRSQRIGFTGPPGSGKSSLLHHALTHFRASTQQRTALVAVDPTSPLTGGAILGDRIRWSVHQTADNLFLRSMASRGSLGGLAAGTRDCVSLLDAVGFDRVLVETVGVGQIGTDIADTVDCLVVVLNPESGDAVQMLKAGLLEMADLYVINKADRPGALALRDHLEGALEIATAAGRDASRPVPPILLTSASESTGLEALWSSLESWFAVAASTGSLEQLRATQRQRLVRQLAEAELRVSFGARLDSAAPGADRWSALATRQIDPYTIATEWLAAVLPDSH